MEVETGDLQVHSQNAQNGRLNFKSFLE